MKNKLVAIEGGEFIMKTDKAVLLRFDDQDIWIPLSQIDDYDDEYETIVIPEWLAVEKGLDPYISDLKIG